MNIRNLLLASMIFCAAPIVCATQSATITKQEQEIVKEWAKIIKSNLTASERATAKAVVLLVRDYFSFVLNKILLVGRDRAECAKEMYKAYKLYDSQIEHKIQAFEEGGGMMDITGSCPLGEFNVIKNSSRTFEDPIKTKTVTLEFVGNDLVLSFKEVTTEDGERVIEKEDAAVITEEDIVKIKKILACYSFMVKSL